MQQPQILIVGAGPTGLTLACVLQRAGISFRIIDKKAQATETSNALGIHARTLELLEDLGVVDDFLAQGKKIHQACMHSKGKTIAKLDLTQINSLYNYVLVLPQSGTEKILGQHLQSKGTHIEYDTKLIDLDEKNSHYTVTIQHESTNTHVHPQYIVACDGAHSNVRRFCGMEFKGNEIPEQFVLCDANVTTDLSLDQVHTFFGAGELFALFPLPSGDVRLIANLTNKDKVELDAVDFNQLTAKRSEKKITINNITWKSTFWIHSNTIKKMQHDKIFFAGDAAHIHSPMGGQGMNTGMQDAYNLGWKLAYVLQNKAPKELLKTYDQERRPLAETLVKETDTLTKFMLSKNPASNFIKTHLMPLLLKTKKLNHKLATRMAMLSLNYPVSDAINYRSAISNRSPQPGDLVPEIKLEPHPFTHYLHGSEYWLLIFCGKNPDSKQVEEIKTLCDNLDNNYKGKINYHIICQQPIEVMKAQLNDEDFSIHRAFNVERPALCLVRPDKYIAYVSSSLATHHPKKRPLSRHPKKREAFIWDL